MALGLVYFSLFIKFILNFKLKIYLKNNDLKELYIGGMFIIQAFNIVFYFFLFLYLDSVLQGDYGVRKSWLYFLKRNKKNKTTPKCS